MRQLLVALALLPIACGHEPGHAESAGAEVTTLDDGEVLVTVLGTNDIHGGLEPKVAANGVAAGGMAFFGGVVTAIKSGLSQRLGARAHVALVDAGDQFQGTLLSNHNEGTLVMSAMSAIGYDAVITGNHDYDFGPVGWLDDRVTASTEDRDPRGALVRDIQSANFPFIGANTYVARSLTDGHGAPLAVGSVGCAPMGIEPDRAVDWTRAARPEYLKPWVVKDYGDVRVAFIGIDNQTTPLVTTGVNVADLCFRDEAAGYLDARAALQGQADVFVMVVHDGNTNTQTGVSTLVGDVLAKGGPRAVDAVIAGHTHFVNNVVVAGVPIIQSGSGGDMFGRIDLVWSTTAHALVPRKTRAYAGIRMFFDKCDPSAHADFCAPHGGGVAYEGVVVAPDATVAAMIDAEKTELAPVAGRVLGTSDGDVGRSFTTESAMSDALTDELLKVASKTAPVDVAIMNTGGIRADFPAGDVTYAAFYSVLPFNNHGVIVTPMAWAELLSLFNRAAQSCGSYDPLMQSGFRITYSQDCRRAGTSGVDAMARIEHVETAPAGGRVPEVLYDRAAGTAPDPARTFAVATLDFLSSGGVGYTGFTVGSPTMTDFGIVREAMTADWLASPAHFVTTSDGRWSKVAP